jgi:hypothetical protein
VGCEAFNKVRRASCSRIFADPEMERAGFLHLSTLGGAPLCEVLRIEDEPERLLLVGLNLLTFAGPHVERP